jgi:hypothetical protein
MNPHVIPDRRDREAGFALILAILALLLLTFLGLTLATTTSTELQIANNYRWGQQALYNAEAGIEAGKAVLRSMPWNTGPPGIFPGDRATPWTGEETTPRPVPPPAPAAGGAPWGNVADAWGNPSRNYENGACDKRGNGMGYGVVLSDGGADSPFQNKTTLFGQTLNGAFTVWIRRPVTSTNMPGCEGCFIDSTQNNVLVLTSEGVAPFTGGNVTTVGDAQTTTGGYREIAQAYRAVQIIEVSLTAGTTSQQAGCEFYGGQSGLGPSGTNFNPCGVGSGAAITGGLPGATGGAEITPTAQ